MTVCVWIPFGRSRCISQPLWFPVASLFTCPSYSTRWKYTLHNDGVILFSLLVSKFQLCKMHFTLENSFPQFLMMAKCAWILVFILFCLLIVNWNRWIFPFPLPPTLVFLQMLLCYSNLLDFVISFVCHIHSSLIEYASPVFEALPQL